MKIKVTYFDAQYEAQCDKCVFTHYSDGDKAGTDKMRMAIKKHVKDSGHSVTVWKHQMIDHSPKTS